MSVQYANAQIVSNGLILAMDFADKTCYVSGSTASFDLSQNTISSSFITGILTNTSSLYTSSLVNLPSYDTAYQGNFIFDGIRNIIALQPYGSGSLAINNFTIESWCKPATTITLPTEATTGFAGLTGQKYVIEPGFSDAAGTNSGAGLSVGTNGLTVVEHTANYIPTILVYTGAISNSSYSNITITYTNKQPKAYINGVLVRTGLTSPKTAVRLLVGGIGGMNYGVFSGSIANVKFYNRTLSDVEILQNYQTQLTRFK